MGKEGKITAIVLAAGSGSRMNSPVKKQYLHIDDKPLLFYSLKTFAESCVDEIVLVVADGEEEYCREKIVDQYGISKVKAIVTGGRERYHSVYNGLKAVEPCGYVLIHDGARPFVTENIIIRALNEAYKNGTCVVGMPVKDTIRIADKDKFAKETPRRELVWSIQTPQVFSYNIIYNAYERFFQDGADLTVTDDAMIVEAMLKTKIRLTEGSYSNIKITTQEDLEIAKVLIHNIRKTSVQRIQVSHK